MRCIRAAELVSLALLAGCSDSMDPGPARLDGNFEGRVLTNGAGEDWYLGLTLRESVGIISGSGFVSVYPGFASTVTGTREGAEVNLEIRPVGSGLMYPFMGTLHGDTLIGVIYPGASTPFPMEFIRVDTVASGEHSSQWTGSLARTVTGSSVFGYNFELNRLNLALTSTGNGIRTDLLFQWEGRDLPGRGTYDVSGTTLPHAFVTEISEEGAVLRNFAVQNGTIQLDVARRWALIGRFSLTATHQNQSVQITGSFSAGCASGIC